MELATLWNFQLQLYGILTCNFLHFYLATNSRQSGSLRYLDETGVNEQWA
jgi:hypothetical protein